MRNLTRTTFLTICLLSFNTLFAQLTLEVQTATTIAACQSSIPIQITIGNETDKIINNGEFHIQLENGMEYLAGSAQHSNLWEKNIQNLENVFLGIRDLPPCTEITFIVEVTQACSDVNGYRNVDLKFSAFGEEETIHLDFFSILPELDIFDVQLTYDETNDVFTRSFKLVNISGAQYGKLILNEKGDIKMLAVNSSVGTLRKGNLELTLEGIDFMTIGNFNDQFDPGEIIEISQKVTIEACTNDYVVDFEVLLPCFEDTCVQILMSHFDIDLSIGKPFLRLGGFPNTGSICDTISSRSKLYVGKYLSGLNIDNVYNITLQLGWNLNENITLENFNDFVVDNCFPLYEMIIGNRHLPVLLHAKNGWYVDFSSLASDPDGPGGLSDLDGDGAFDDLDDLDTLNYEMKFSIDQSCFNGNCSPWSPVFIQHKLITMWTYTNYCGVLDTTSIKDATYYYEDKSRYPNGIRLTNKYTYDGDQDTLSIDIKELITGLSDGFFGIICDENDGMKISLELEDFYSIKPNEIITNLKGDPINYQLTSSHIILMTDTSQSNIRIPITMHCDPSNKPITDPRKTECTNSCSSNLNRPYLFNVNVEYYCDRSCPVPMRDNCSYTYEVYVFCDDHEPSFATTVGQLKMEDPQIKRLSRGYVDSSKTKMIDIEDPGIDRTNLLLWDTFLLEIPIVVGCNADYSNVFISISQAKETDSTDFGYKFFGDIELEYSQIGTAKQNCTVPFPNIVKRTTSWSMGINASNLLTSCFSNTFKKGDTLKLLLHGYITPDIIRTEWRQAGVSELSCELNYKQDHCNFKERTEFDDFYVYIYNSGTLRYADRFIHKEKGAKSGIFFTIPSCGTSWLQLELLPSLYRFAAFFGKGENNIFPFPNEFRQPLLIEEFIVKLPPILEYDHSRSFIFKTHHNLNDSLGVGAPSERDSSGWTILTFENLLKFTNFSSAKYYLNIGVKPKCHIKNTSESIVRRRYRFNTHKKSDHQVVKSQKSKILSSIEGTVSTFEDRSKTLFKDSITSWDLYLSYTGLTIRAFGFSPIYNPWIYLESPSGDIEVLYLEDHRDPSNPIRINPIPVVGKSAWMIGIDSIFEPGQFKLFAKVRSCEFDSLIWRLGARCGPTPLDFDLIDPYCQEIAEKKTLFVDPKEARMQFEINQADSGLITACAPMQFEIIMKNFGLGHAFNVKLYTQVPAGVSVTGATIWWDDAGSKLSLGAAIISGKPGEYYWEVPDQAITGGFPGVLTPTNELHAILDFTTDCSVENGEYLRFGASYEQLCGKIDSTVWINSALISSKDDSQQNENYKLSLNVVDIDSCGDEYVFNITLKYKGEVPSKLDKYYFVFDRKLRYVNGSFDPIRNILSSSPAHKINDDTETLIFGIESGVIKGDSIVFSFIIQNTCISNCTYTDFNHFITSPTTVTCATAPGGNCDRHVEINSWQMDHFKFFPDIAIDSGWVDFGAVVGGDQELMFHYVMKGKSLVIPKGGLVVDFYHDSNGDGVLDGGDEWLFDDDIQVDQLKDGREILFHTKKTVAQDKTCPIFMVIDPDHNPCYCISDTFILGIDITEFESRHLSICDDQTLNVGYDNLDHLSFDWASNPYLNATDIADPIYLFEGSLNDGEIYYDTLYVQIGQSGLCSVLDTVFIEVSSLEANLVLYASVLCPGDSTAIIGLENSLKSGWKIKWIGSQDTSEILENIPAGEYTAIITNDLGCMAEKTIVVESPDLLESEIEGSGLNCYGDKDAAISVKIKGGTTDYKYEWEDGTTDTMRNNLGAGIYTITVTDKNGCEIVDTIEFEAPDSLSAQVNLAHYYCEEGLGEGNVKVKGGVPGYTISWSDGQSGDHVTDLEAGDYTLTITDANGCELEQEITIEQLTTNYTLGASPDSVIEVLLNEMVTLGYQFDGTATAIEWSPSDYLSCTDCPNPTVSPIDDISYTVTITDEHGCMYEIDVRVIVKKNKQHYVPNVFSPNGDGINDYFRPQFDTSVSGVYDLDIYDRWGNLVYALHDQSMTSNHNGWDGKFKGKSLNPNVYVYILNIRHDDGEESVESRSLTLLR